MSSRLAMRVERLKRKRVSELSPEDIRVLRSWFNRVRGRSARLDRRYTARSPKYVGTWLHSPNRYDIPGVDTKEKIITAKLSLRRTGLKNVYIISLEFSPRYRDLLNKALEKIQTYGHDISKDIYLRSYDYPYRHLVLDLGRYDPDYPKDALVRIKLLKRILEKQGYKLVMLGYKSTSLKEGLSDRKIDEITSRILQILDGAVIWAEEPKNPSDRARVEKIVKTWYLLRDLITKAAREVYGEKKVVTLDPKLYVYDEKEKKAYNVFLRTYRYGYTPMIYENDNPPRADFARAWTRPGKPIYIYDFNVIEDFLSRKPSDGTYTLVHEAMHKAGVISGPGELHEGSAYLIRNILWTEGSNELVTWRYLSEYLGNPRETAKLVAQESPYVWDALVVAAVAKILGYKTVWDFIRDKYHKRLSNDDLLKAAEKLIRMLSKRFKNTMDKSAFRRWKEMLREQILGRISLVASISEPPAGAPEAIYEYAKDVLEASLGRAFVETLARESYLIRGKY